jgi:hypothetical protein
MSSETTPALVPLPPVEPIKITDYQVNRITGCWIWTGLCDHHGYPIDDYGRFIDHEVYQEHKGEIAEGYGVGRLCWDTRCINPAHLEPETGLLSNRDHPSNRLNMTLARQIRVKAAAGVPTRILATQYSVTTSTIRGVLLNMTWVDPEYRPLLKAVSRHPANLKTVRKVRALRAKGMSYGEIVDRVHIGRKKVIAYCSGRYLGAEYNSLFAL